MGVPAFYSWLLKRYPLITQKATMTEIPNIDCLYLDMNGILYKCARDEKIMFKDLLVDKNFDELWVQIFNYINNIVNTVGPTKILFLGLDGPAPRAKQNQQRSRRFQSAKGYAELNKSLQNCGFLSVEQTFKNNSISPGTDFMHELNEQLKFFIAKKYNEDEKWKNLRVIFSGSNVPGEGEHKILSYMRQYASAENYDINTTHCIYGADADLIMLGLSTHIPYVSIIRESMTYGREAAPAAKREYEEPDFQIIYLNMVREYMDLEFSKMKDSMKHLTYDINQIIDDFILLCFFVGNDFLPKCYCFDIRQGNVEELIKCYKELLKTSDTYINNRGEINWKGMEKLLELLSGFEQKLVSARAGEIQDNYNQRKLYKYDDMCDDNEEDEEEGAQFDKRNEDTFENYNKEQVAQQIENAKLLKKEKEFLQQLEVIFKDDQTEARKLYYQEKLEFDLEEQDSLCQLDFLMSKYVEGLQFVLSYYYKGCPSWSWYFPFYYSPMVTDLYNYVKYYNSTEEGLNITFKKGQAYEPLRQLMCILHPENHALLPPEMSKLLTEKDSPLRSPVDYYPQTFKVDPFGAFWEHEYIVSLPFLSEEVLEEAYKTIDMSKLSDYDKSRNQLGSNILFYLDNKNKKDLQTIRSTLPYYKDFKIPLKTHTFSLDVDIICNVKQVPLEYNLKKSPFPSLHTKKIKDSYFKEMKAKDYKYYRMMLELQEEVNLDYNVTPKDYLPVYTTYPQYRKGYIIGWMDDKQLYKIKSGAIDLLTSVGYKKEDHSYIYEKALDDCRDTLEAQGIAYDRESQIQRRILFIRYYPTIERSSSGKVVENQDIFHENFYIATAFSNEQKMIKKCEIRDFKGIKEEFPLGSQVLVFDERYLGNRGFVKSYRKTKSTTSVMVQMYEQPEYFNDQTFRKIQRDNSTYYSISYIAQELKLNSLILLALLDEVVIVLDEERPSSHKLQKRLNIGLRLISRFNNMVVPELVRLPDGDYNLRDFQKFHQYNQLEISDEAAKLVRAYYDQIKNTNILHLINDCIKARTRVKLNVNDIFKIDPVTNPDFDPNIELVKIYVWIVQNSTALPLCPVNGQVMHQTAIPSLTQNKKPMSTEIRKEELFDPNVLQRECDYLYIPMYFKSHPFYHQIGDRVVNCNSVARLNAPPFGAYGTIVGIIDTQVQVVFDKPFIGGTNLGGKCEWLHGSLVYFDEVFNLEGSDRNTWRQYLVRRDDTREEYGWDRKIAQYAPSFKKPAIQSKKEHDLVISKQESQNIFENLQTNEDQEKLQEKPRKNNNKEQQEKPKDSQKAKQSSNTNTYNNESKDKPLTLEEIEQQQLKKTQQNQQKKDKPKTEKAQKPMTLDQLDQMQLQQQNPPIQEKEPAVMNLQEMEAKVIKDSQNQKQQQQKPKEQNPDKKKKMHDKLLQALNNQNKSMQNYQKQQQPQPQPQPQTLSQIEQQQQHQQLQSQAIDLNQIEQQLVQKEQEQFQKIASGAQQIFQNLTAQTTEPVNLEGTVDLAQIEAQMIQQQQQKQQEQEKQEEQKHD